MALQQRLLVSAVTVLVASLMLTGCGSYEFGLGSGTQNAGAGDVDNAAATTGAAKEKLAATQPVGYVTDQLVATTVPQMGNVVTDAKGWILYRFDNDKSKPSKSTCSGTCARIWPPVLADKKLKLSGVSGAKVGTLRRPDGGTQVTIGGWPIYRYVGDKKPGSWRGQNVNGDWFVISKNGKKNLTCLPKVSKPVKAPASSTTGY